MGATLKIQLFAAVAAASALSMAGTANATINAPVPTTNFITVGNLDWAWAGPCAPFAGNTCNDFFAGDVDTMTAFQAADGWHIPTAAEWATRPAWTDFAGACASPWFGSGWGHCDFGDTLYDYGYGGGDQGAYSETWFVRGAVPEPAAWLLMIAGFGMIGATLRRRAAVVA